MSDDKSNENISFDAQRLNEEIEAGKREAPKVDTAGDYERSKEYAYGTGGGEETEENKVTGDPEAFLSMAKEINSNSEA